MEIQTIKENLSIQMVLAYYGLRPDKNQRLHCPFHPDKTPSLQIYPKTNTYCCFSSNCTAGTGDQVQFIELMEKCTKHEALVKAASLAERHGSSNLPRQDAELLHNETDNLDRIAVLTKVFSKHRYPVQIIGFVMQQLSILAKPIIWTG